MNELIRKNELQLPSNRVFGLFLGFLCFCLSLFFFLTDRHHVVNVALTAGILLATLAFISPKILLPLNWLWMRFGLLLSMVVKPIVMGMVFSIFFIPLGVYMRIIGRDELKLSNIDRRTFWQSRTTLERKDNFFHQQF